MLLVLRRDVSWFQNCFAEKFLTVEKKAQSCSVLRLKIDENCKCRSDSWRCCWVIDCLISGLLDKKKSIEVLCAKFEKNPTPKLRQTFLKNMRNASLKSVTAKKNNDINSAVVVIVDVVSSLRTCCRTWSSRSGWAWRTAWRTWCTWRGPSS